VIGEEDQKAIKPQRKNSEFKDRPSCCGASAQASALLVPMPSSH